MKNSIYLVFIVLATILSCSTSKQSAESHSFKKSIDTLFISRPFCVITASQDGKKSFDSELSRTNEELIFKTSMNLLDAKYCLKEFRILPDSLLFRELFNSTEKLSVSNAADIVNPILGKYDLAGYPEAVLLLFYNAEYNPAFEPNFNVKQGMGTNRIIINPYTKPLVRLDVLLLDMKSAKLQYYDCTITSNSDPRLT